MQFSVISSTFVWGPSYPFAVMQLAFSTTPVSWAWKKRIDNYVYVIISKLGSHRYTINGAWRLTVSLPCDHQTKFLMIVLVKSWLSLNIIDSISILSVLTYVYMLYHWYLPSYIINIDVCNYISVANPGLGPLRVTPTWYCLSILKPLKFALNKSFILDFGWTQCPDSNHHD